MMSSAVHDLKFSFRLRYTDISITVEVLVILVYTLINHYARRNYSIY